jgi:gas vesicle protein
MIDIGPEAETQIQDMLKALRQIRTSIDQAHSSIEDIIQAIEGANLDLKRAEELLKPEELQAFAGEIQKLQEALKNILHPSYLWEIRMYLNKSQNTLTQISETLNNAQQQIRQIQTDLERWKEEGQATQNALRGNLKGLDNVATIIQRALSHFQESDSPLDFDETVRTVADLLHGSLRLATLVFQPQQLQQMAGAETRASLSLDLLRKRWGEWLRELAKYVRDVSKQAEQVARLEEGTQAEAFREAFADFQKACREASLSARLSPQWPSAPRFWPPGGGSRGPL